MNTTINTLFHVVERLNNRSLDIFIDSIVSSRIRREVSNEQKEESLLLEKINKGLSLKQVERFKILDQKRFDEILTSEEYAELSALVEKIENLNVRRLKHLIALSKLRNVSVRELVTQLNLSPNNG